MAGFRKAKAEQAAIKMGIYGPPGSGREARAPAAGRRACKGFR